MGGCRHCNSVFARVRIASLRIAAAWNNGQITVYDGKKKISWLYFVKNEQSELVIIIQRQLREIAVPDTYITTDNYFYLVPLTAHAPAARHYLCIRFIQ